MGFIVGHYYQINTKRYDKPTIDSWYRLKIWDTTKYIQKKLIKIVDTHLFFENVNGGEAVGFWDDSDVGSEKGKTWMEAPNPIVFVQEEIDV